jgi:asparagine synthase (glutamine-hydrolysing)
MRDKYSINGCGIAGIASFGKDRKDILKDCNFYSMLDSLKHRGPDNSSSWSCEKVILGHTRLSILDLSDKGTQPMVRDYLVITYNGEIYNFIQIRNKLEKLGFSFSSETDTEVIIRAYQAWGVKCVEEFDGMFALCIYNTLDNSLFLARDHIGIKPLYYYIDQNYFLFGSEVQTLLKSDYIPKEVNKDLLYRQVILPFILQSNIEETLINHIYSLLPGHYMLLNLNNGSKDIYKYWDLPEKERSFNTNNYIENEVTVLNSLLEKSIKNRLISDIPVAGLLSGGLDSSLIVSIACNNVIQDGKFKCFTINYQDQKFETSDSDCYEDLEYSKLLVRSLGHRVSHVHVTAPFKNFNPEIVDDILDFSTLTEDPRLIGIFYNYKIINEHGIKVVLNGQGADEIMGGYAAVNPIVIGAIQEEFTKDNLSKWLLQCSHFNPGILNPCVLNIKQQLFDEQYKFFDSFHGSALRKAHCFLAKTILHQILRFEDLLSMKFGIECRVPFLDKEIMSWAFSIPFEKHINMQEKIGKLLLKEAARKHLPKEIIERTKKPFPAPDYDHLHKDLIVYFNDNLLEIRKSYLINHIFNKSIYEVTSLSFYDLWLIIFLFRWEHKLDNF